MTTIELEIEKLKKDRETCFYYYMEGLYRIYSVNKIDYLLNPGLCLLRSNIKEIDETIKYYE
jgi:hypothetical protein